MKLIKTMSSKQFQAYKELGFIVQTKFYELGLDEPIIWVSNKKGFVDREVYERGAIIKKYDIVSYERLQELNNQASAELRLIGE